MSAARTIRELLRPDDYVIVVEHDLSVLDYLSDFICVLYGRPAVYGVVTLPASVREGINIFLDGNIPTENLRFREESLTFRIAEAGEEFMVDRARGFSYPTMVRSRGAYFPFSSRALTYREGKNIGGFPLEHRRWRVHRL